MEHPVTPGSVWLEISANNDGDYETVVCLTSIGKEDSVGEIDTSSQCGPGFIPGVLSLSRPFEGILAQDPDTGKASGTDLRVLMYAKTLIGYRISTLTDPQEGDEIEVGEGYIFSLSSTYGFNSSATFSGTIRPVGVPAISEES